jgi:MFS family permease
VLLIALIFGMLGNAVYALSFNGIMLLVGRFFVGFFTGGLNAVVRSYIARATTFTERSKVLNFLVASFTLSLTLGPGNKIINIHVHLCDESEPTQRKFLLDLCCFSVILKE